MGNDVPGCVHLALVEEDITLRGIFVFGSHYQYVLFEPCITVTDNRLATGVACVRWIR